MIETALKYKNAGLCPLPAAIETKHPTISKWGVYRQAPPTEIKLRNMFINAEAICVLTGKASGNLEVIDFDCKGELFNAWKKKIDHALYCRLVVESSPSGGLHVAYRIDSTVSGNSKLAQRSISEVGRQTLIETRGEGGLVLIAPSPGYELIWGDYEHLPILAKEEHRALIDAAKSLTEIQETDRQAPAIASRSTDGRPGDDFNQRGDIRALLQRHGWKLARSGDNEHWTRPDKTDGSTSATYKDGVFYVFSSNAAPFAPNVAYSNFRVFTLLEHGGDFFSASSALRADGYGEDEDERNNGIDISALINVLESPSSNAGEDKFLDPGQTPERLLSVPGFINDLVAHTMDTAPYPDRILAFGAAIALQALLTGRKVQDESGNRTNLYILTLANSGSGKDHPRKVNQNLLNNFGKASMIGDSFASGEGLEDAMFLNPAMLFQTDEMDDLVAGIAAGREERWKRVSTALLKFFSSASNFYCMRAKSGDTSKTINQPHLVIYGCAVPKFFYQAFSEKLLNNGFFSRLLILESTKRGKGKDSTIKEFPEGVIRSAQYWLKDYYVGKGNLAEENAKPLTIKHNDDAKKVFKDFREYCDGEYTDAQERDDTIAMTTWTRPNEKALRLAMIYACSDNPLNPVIDYDAATWATEFCLHQTKRMLYMTERYFLQSEIHDHCNRVIEFLKKKTNGVANKTELTRRFQWGVEEHRKVRESLVEQGVIECGQAKEKSGRPQFIYKLIRE